MKIKQKKCGFWSMGCVLRGRGGGSGVVFVWVWEKGEFGVVWVWGQGVCVLSLAIPY